MFYSVTRLWFDPTTTDVHDNRALAQLARRVREKFGVAVMGQGGTVGEPTMGLVIAAVGDRADRLSSLIDAVCRFCEDDGFGRVESEESSINAVDGP